MPTQRPFLSNFLAAFRAHSSQLPKAQPSISSSGAVAASTQTIWTSSQPTSKTQSQNSSSSDISSPRPIPPQKQNAYPPAQASSHGERQYHALQHNVSPQTHLPRSPPTPGVSSQGGLPVFGPPNKPQPSYPTPQESRGWSEQSRKSRRGSDSSSDGGFREVKGAGWFVGGRTPQGEEKYYKLSMVKRDRSSDRISADQLSL